MATRKRIAIVTVLYVTSPKHRSFAIETLKHFKSSKHELVNIGVVNRLDTKFTPGLVELYDHIIQNTQNCLSKAWNIGIDYALKQGFDYVLCPNLDVVSRRDTIDSLIDLALQYPDALMWCPTELTGDKKALREFKADPNISLVPQSHSFSYFMIDKRLFAEVGRFDEDFIPAYFEDWDMRDRIHASGNYIVRGLHIPFFHYENQARRNDRRLAAHVVRMFKVNEKIYLTKKRAIQSRLRRMTGRYSSI
jgi:GT2 family glycosyltransferase